MPKVLCTSAHKRGKVFDVTGAGDTVIAMTMASLVASGISLRDAVPIANKAGGIVVGKFGTAAVGWRNCWRRWGELRGKHGTELENWWIHRFAHSFDALTESEARYLARTETIDTIRNQIIDSQ